MPKKIRIRARQEASCRMADSASWRLQVKPKVWEMAVGSTDDVPPAQHVALALVCANKHIQYMHSLAQAAHTFSCMIDAAPASADQCTENSGHAYYESGMKRNLISRFFFHHARHQLERSPTPGTARPSVGSEPGLEPRATASWASFLVHPPQEIIPFPFVVDFLSYGSKLFFSLTVFG